MNSTIHELLLNSTLLVTLTVLFAFLSKNKASSAFKEKSYLGILFGIITIIGMKFPLAVAPGIFYDGRSIVLSVAGLFGGYISGAISLTMALAYRITIGGNGVWAGSATIVSSVAIGWLFRWISDNKPEDITALRLYFLGMFNHLAMLACQFLLINTDSIAIIKNIGAPVLAIFPAINMLMGIILRNEIRRTKAEEKIKKSESHYKRIFASIETGVITTDSLGNVTFINPIAIKLTGWLETEAAGLPLRQVFIAKEELSGNRITCPIEEILQHGKSFQLSNNPILISKDGTEVPIASNCSPVTDENGEITGLILSFKDQTEERTLKSQLSESERLYHTLTAKSPVGIFRTTSNGKTTYVNPQWCEISGIQSEKALDFGWLREVHPEDKSKIEEGWQKATAMQTVSKVEFRFVKEDETSTWVMGTAVPEFDKNNKLVGYIGTIIDINERKKAEDQLIQSYENFHRTMEDSPLGMRIISENGKTVYINSALLALFNYSSLEEFINTPSAQRYTPESLKEHEERKENRKKGITEEADYEIEIKTSTGEIKNLLVKRKVIYWDNKKQYLAIYQDITERKKAESELLLFRRAINQSPVSTVITNNKGEIIYANPKFSEISGYSLQEIKGKTPSILKSGHHSNEYYKKMWQTITNGQDWKGEFLNKRSNGDLFWESAVISSITDEKGQTSHFIGVKEDITEKKKIISDLKQAKEKAEESDRLKSAFLANMSHEIRTPLNVILGFTNLLIENRDLDDQAREEFVSILNQSSENLLKVINDILDISKIETGQLRFNNVQFDALPVIQKLQTITAQQLKKADKSTIRLTCKVSEKPVFIFTDQVRFNQIFSNLLGNAIKFTKEGEIAFGIKETDEKNATFFVSDTGIGIQQKKQSEVFERFRQIEDSSTRSVGGTGLGLSISKKLVEQMGGTISLQSEEGKGTTFFFKIPIHQ